jgi:hypothetical protein
MRDSPKNAFSAEPQLAKAPVDKKNINKKEFLLHLPCPVKKISLFFMIFIAHFLIYG